MKKVLAIFLCAALLLAGCAYDKDHDGGYKPRGGDLPTTATAEKDSAAFVAAALIEAGQVARDVYELRPVGDALEAVYLRTNGVGVEIYKYAEDSETLAYVRKNGKYPLRDDAGTLLAEKRAATNGHFVLMIPKDENSKGEDITKLNDRLEQRFLELEL